MLRWGPEPLILAIRVLKIKRPQYLFKVFIIPRDTMARVAFIGDNSIEYISSLLDIWNNGDCAVLIEGGFRLKHHTR